MRDPMTTDLREQRDHVVTATRNTDAAFAYLLILAGLIGIAASFALTLDKFELLGHPSAKLLCNINQVLQCGTNLEAWQGRVFGFPNPLIGLVCFPAPVIVGVALLGNVIFPKWFWAALNLGMLLALTFIAWLAAESLYVLHTLCPWCVVVYLAVIPMALAVTLLNMREQRIPVSAGLSRLGGAVYPWVPLISVLTYVAIFALAQLQLNILGA